MRFAPWFVLFGFLLLAVVIDEAKGTPAASAPTVNAGEKKPQWELSVTPENEAGTRSVAATLRADTPITSGFSQVTPTLVLRYGHGRILALVNFDSFLGSGETVAVTVTFGREPGVVQAWPLSADGRAAFAPGDALAFVQQLQKVESVSLRVAPAKREPFTVLFSPRQTDLVLKALLAAGVKYGS